MKTHLSILLIFWCLAANAQEQNHNSASIKYIQDYYSEFSIGYDFDGEYITLSKNYKAIFSDKVFIIFQN